MDTDILKAYLKQDDHVKHEWALSQFLNRGSPKKAWTQHVWAVTEANGHENGMTDKQHLHGLAVTLVIRSARNKLGFIISCHFRITCTLLTSVCYVEVQA
jgi:hypothetical protein